jgi:hypothetical protein
MEAPDAFFRRTCGNLKQLLEPWRAAALPDLEPHEAKRLLYYLVFMHEAAGTIWRQLNPTTDEVVSVYALTTNPCLELSLAVDSEFGLSLKSHAFVFFTERIRTELPTHANLLPDLTPRLLQIVNTGRELPPGVAATFCSDANNFMQDVYALYTEILAAPSARNIERTLGMAARCMVDLHRLQASAFELWVEDDRRRWTED